MSIEKERKAFEEWASKETKWDLYWSENINQYMDHQTNAAWFAWQASANREGYKLVHVEASKACLSNLGDVIFDNFGTTTTEVDRCAEKAYKAMIGAIE